MNAMKPMSAFSQKENHDEYEGMYGMTYTPHPLPPKLIQKPFQEVFNRFNSTAEEFILPAIGYLTLEQMKALEDIATCKTADAGFSVYGCNNCGAITYNYNKCKNRNCPICQNLKTYIWADQRKAEVFDSDYYHVVMTVPHELNPLFYENQKELYGLLHNCVSSAIIEYAKDDDHLGGTPGIIQILHTWDQHLNYHVHIHTIVTGLGLTNEGKLVYNKSDGFLMPKKVLEDLVKYKFMDSLKSMYNNNTLSLESMASKYKNHYEWNELINKMYETQWVSFIKETFNGNGNAIDYLARYTNKVAIGNSRIQSVEGGIVTFTSRDSEGKQTIKNQLSCEEFVGRYLTHVLPSGFQKIRYYGIFANGCRKKNVDHILKLQGNKQRLYCYKEPTEKEVLKVEFHVNLDVCPKCSQKGTMKQIDYVMGSLSYTYIPLGKKMGWLRNYLEGVG